MKYVFSRTALLLIAGTVLTAGMLVGPGASSASAAGALQLSKPVIAGGTAVGSTAWVSVVVEPTGAGLSYQWSIDGAKIPGGVNGEIKLKKIYQGKHISVRVTAKLSGYPDVTKSSANTKVAAKGVLTVAIRDTAHPCPSSQQVSTAIKKSRKFGSDATYAEVIACSGNYAGGYIHEEPADEFISYDTALIMKRDSKGWKLLSHDSCTSKLPKSVYKSACTGG